MRNSSTRCDGDIAELGTWVESTFKGNRELTSMIASEKSRTMAAENILGRYGQASPRLKEILAKFVEEEEVDNAVRLSALREALSSLAKQAAKSSNFQGAMV